MSRKIALIFGLAMTVTHGPAAANPAMGQWAESLPGPYVGTLIYTLCPIRTLGGIGCYDSKVEAYGQLCYQVAAVSTLPFWRQGHRYEPRPMRWRCENPLRQGTFSDEDLKDIERYAR